MSPHTAFLIAVVLAAVGVLYDLTLRAWSDLLCCAALGMIGLAFVLRT